MQNAFIESFNGRLRDELLNETLFTSLAQVRVALGCWRPGYNGASRTRSSDGRRPSNLLPPSARDGIWRCATRKAPRQIPSQTPPERLNTTQGANSALDKTWGQRQQDAAMSHTAEFAGDRRKLTRTHGSLALAHLFGFMDIINSGSDPGYRIINLSKLIVWQLF
jgi:hypothetical protein